MKAFFKRSYVFWPLLSTCLVIGLGLLLTYLPRGLWFHGVWTSQPSLYEGQSLGQRFENMFWYWDALRYEQIALKGYDVASTDLAFFPGWPWVLQWFNATSAFTRTFYVCLINLILLIVASWSWERSLRRVSPSWSARYLALFPTAVFFIAPYAETVFIAMSGLCVMALVEENILLLMLSLMGVVFFKHVGTLVAVALLACAWIGYATKQKSLRIALAATVGSLLSLAGLFIFYWNLCGDPLGWAKAQSKWDRHLATPIQFFADLHGKPLDWAIYAIFALVAYGYLLIKGYRALKNLLQAKTSSPNDQAKNFIYLCLFAYVAALLTFVLFGTSIQSIYRIVILAVPTTLLIPILMNSLKRPGRIVFGSFWALLFLMNLYKFVSGLHLP